VESNGSEKNQLSMDIENEENPKPKKVISLFDNFHKKQANPYRNKFN